MFVLVHYSVTEISEEEDIAEVCAVKLHTCDLLLYHMLEYMHSFDRFT